jgi:predicted nucleic acid-binding protein
LSRICLDTSAYSQFKRGDPAVVDLVDAAEWVGVPTVVIGELLSGFARSAKRARNISELDELLATPVVHEIPVDREVAEVYAEILAGLRQAGTPLPTNDIWIAAAAARAGATIVTYDAHFAVIGRVGSILLEAPR